MTRADPETTANEMKLSHIDSFIEVTPLDLRSLSDLLGQINDDDAFEMIYDGIEANVWRHFKQPSKNAFAVRFFAEHCEFEAFAFTQGIIKCQPQQVYEWEKIGKKKLANFMRRKWGVRF